MKKIKIQLFFLILLLFSNIQCEGEGSECSECQPGEELNDMRCLQIDSTKKQCMICDEISKGESQYYSRKYTVNNEPYCHKVGKSGFSGFYLINNSFQIVTSCKEFGLVTLGSICYSQCPDHSTLVANTNKCNCNYYFSKEIKNGLTYIKCLGENVPCDSGYNYINEKECVKACPSNKLYLSEINIGSKILYSCEGNCEKKKYSIQSPLGKIIKYCLDSCPNEAKYYYDDNICREKCSNSPKDFYILENQNYYKCIDHLNINDQECPNDYLINISSEDYIFQCVPQNSGCDNNFPYIFIKDGRTYCLKSCEETNILFFDYIQSYLYEDDKKCMDINNLEANYYMIDKEKRIVNQCSEESYWPYYNGNKCVSNCGDKYIDNATNKCLDNCNSNQFLDEKTNICFNSCPDYLGRGFHDQNRKCVACGIEGEGKGFHKLVDDSTCYSECPGSFKHNYLNNICFDGDCKDHNYKFSSKEHPEICYYSCKDIGEEYIIEKEFVCYKESEIGIYSTEFENFYFYETSYGFKKYINKDNAINECFSNGLKYLKGNQCIKNCAENDYKVYPSKGNFGICFENLSDCKEKYKFYNTISHICSNSCDGYTINNNEGNLVDEKGSNCLSKCPSNYPFLDGNICKQNCEDCYIEEDGIKKCTSKGDYYIQTIDGYKKCVNYCTNSQKGEDENGIPIFSYYDENKHCRDSCIGNTGFEFSEEAINEHKPCLSECTSDKYYYLDKKICLKKCDKFYEKNSKICKEKCNDGEFIHPGNICTNDSCPKNAPFYIENINGEITVNECVSSCPEGFLFMIENKKCVENDSEKKNLYGGLIESCPQGYRDSDVSNDCSNPCENNNYFSRETNSEEYSCLSEIEINEANCKYLTEIKECVNNCPIGRHFIKGNECVSSCEEGFYTKFIEQNDYIIYECLESIESCTQKNQMKQIYTTKECVNSCEDYGLYEYGDICYSDCQSIGKYDPVKNNDNALICENDCGELYYNNEDKICEEECLFTKAKIINDNNESKLCLNKCDITSSYKYLQIKDNKLHCSRNCDQDQRYLITNYKCIPKCPSTYYVDFSTKECISQCTKKVYLKGNEYYCSDKCLDGNYIYKDSNICISSCNFEDYIIFDEKTCIKDCTSLNIESKKYYFYDYTIDEDSIKENICIDGNSNTEGNKQFIRKNNHWDLNCDTNPEGDYYYIKDTKICLEKSGCEGKKFDGSICKDNCLDSDSNKYNDGTEFCLPNCYYSSQQKIYQTSQFTCQDNSSNYILEKNILKSECITNNYHIDNQCVIECPKGKNFIEDENNICLDDCTETKQYYTIDSTNPKIFKCQENCNSYTILDKTKKAKLCLGDKCKSPYIYYISSETETQKECFEKCPEGFDYFFIPNESDKENIKCIDSESIPDIYILLQNTKKYIKKEECYPYYINIDSNECVIKYSQGQVFYKKDDNFNYCSDSCKKISEMINEDLHLDLNGIQCFNGDCPDNEVMEELEEDKQCQCENLYYNDISNGMKVCIDKNEINCSKQLEYPYLISGTNECSPTCEGVLSLNGSICNLEENYECPENSQIKTLSNNLKQCVCKNKFYHYETENSKEIYCLPENSICPRNELENFNRELFIKDTNECVEYCPFDGQTKKYGKTCVKICPIMSVVVKDECFCQDKWYLNEKDEMICTNECPNEKPIIIDETKECVKTCINTKYPVYYNNKCYSNCTLFPETMQIDGITKDIINENSNHEYKGYSLFERFGKYGESICYCKGPWYMDGENIVCSKEENKECNVFEQTIQFKYNVLPTKECVQDCPNLFDYRFNNYCFKSCDIGNELLEFNENEQIEKDGEKKICKCKTFWKYDNKDISKIICLENCEENYLLIVATNECYNSKQCREEYPLLFNNQCFNKTNCPINTIYNEDSPRTCSCIKYYYINKENDLIVCLGENDNCPPEYPYLIYSKNKCVEDGDEELNNYKNFNGVYYNNCPQNSKYDESQQKCICNILYGKWYTDLNNNLICGQKECPSVKEKTILETGECISKCYDNDNRLEYNGICYEECPELTKEDENHVCKLEPSDSTSNVTEFAQKLQNNILNLYLESKSEKSEDEEEKEDSKIIKLENTNSTVEFYGVSKNEKKSKEKHNNKAKESASLSYIDLSECINKIYEANNMNSDDEIIILKFDILDTPKEYLINPVEYKFINSRNGKELDASVCAHGAIKISYPFFNIIDKYDELSKRKRILKAITIDINNDKDLNTLKDKYNIGKEINDEYSYVDTFNSKDNIYTDFCNAVEINGKDLVLEDRMKYLLPHYSLCEQNCTYNHTDFEEERIYCDCSFKSEFDLNREHEAEVELNENVVTQSQDGNSNFPVLKCISSLGDSKRIKKNIAFYYMLIIIIIEICLLIMTIIFGINSFKYYFNNKVCDNDETENDIELDVNEKKNNYNEIIKTTQRTLNSPPKRSNGENEEDKKEENNKVINNEPQNEENKNGIQFIPDDLLFLYFNDNDKGVRKKLEKNTLPFSINKGTKVLLQKMENVDYANVTANGPFNDNQNLIEIIDDNENKIDINIESINESLFDNDNINEKNKNKKNEKEIVMISEEKIYKRENLKNYIINDLDEIEEDKDDKVNKGFFEEIQLEQRFLTKDYKFVNNKNENGLLIIILTEILDKFYIIKNILFIRKYDIMYLNLSIYVLYHIILLNILIMFYDIKTIKNIWNKENYPGIGFYLGYGIISILITWIIYIIITCLMTNKGKFNEIMNIRKSKKKGKETKAILINKKVDSLISKNKKKIIVYNIVQFILIVFFFLYSVTFCAVYSGTMSRVFTSYGIAILELIILKIIYGLILSLLRSYSLSNQKKGLYNFVLFFDKYLV